MYYPAAVARGHIRFDCVRAGQCLYHSLTAAKVQIHPSSALWGEEPEPKAAWEIKRAARLVEEMEIRGIVGPASGSKARDIIHVPSKAREYRVVEKVEFFQ